MSRQIEVRYRVEGSAESHSLTLYGDSTMGSFKAYATAVHGIDPDQYKVTIHHAQSGARLRSHVVFENPVYDLVVKKTPRL